MAAVPAAAEAAEPVDPATALLDVRRAAVAERVRVARADKQLKQRADDKERASAAKEQQVQVMYKDHSTFFSEERAAFEHQKADRQRAAFEQQDKVKDYRKQGNFGATKFIKP